MPLEAGSRLGPYEILAMIGAGGMGEVYRGRDTRLDRAVAIKILPAHLAQQQELRDRFEREARAVGALNHAHVCTLYDVGEQDGVHFLVMEYIEGETLGERLSRGPLPLSQALKCAVEIADALDKAHRQGVVHRDLKPGNVMLTKSGSKLLDFGLARLKQGGPAATFAAASALPTNLSGLTGQGAILGTLQYMAPEQLEGKEADPRTDIFAFGALLFEMVTGRKAFEGKSQVSLIGAILERDPAPIASFQPASPPELDRIIRRCLAKDPDERWQTMTDLTAQLSWLTADEASVTPTAFAPDVGANARRAQLWRVGAIALFLITISLAVFSFYPRETTSGLARFVVLPPGKTVLASTLAGEFVAGAVSPDGRRIVFTARDDDGKILLWVRPLESLLAEALPGTDEAGLPFWAPDSRQVGFFAQGKLKKIDVTGGPPQTLCDAPTGRGGTWNRDGVILFGNSNQSLFRVSSNGGDVVEVTKLNHPEVSHRGPAFLPDNNHFVYLATSSEGSRVFLGALDSMESKALLQSDSTVLYAPPGYLLFARQGTLLAQRIREKTYEPEGAAVPVAEQVAHFNYFLAASVSTNGTLTYRTTPGASGLIRRLGWYNRTGKLIESIGPAADYMGMDVAPDGRRIAVHRHERGGGDVWIMESAKGLMSKLTLNAAEDNSMPIWSPDGARVAFASHRGQNWGIYQKRVDGTGKEELLVESADPKSPMAWSPDGKFIVYWNLDPTTQSDLWLLPLAGGSKPQALVKTEAEERLAQISPDGKWIAYRSNATGRVEIYVRPFPTGESVWQLTTDGGSSPRWGGNGTELIYLSPSAVFGKIMAVPVTAAGTTFKWGTAQPLFDSGYDGGITHNSYHDFAVSPDGQRFLIPRPESALDGGAAPAPITVVLNWTEIVKGK